MLNNLSAQFTLSKTITPNVKKIYIKLNKIDQLNLKNTSDNKVYVSANNEFKDSGNFEIVEKHGELKIEEIVRQTNESFELDKECAIQPLYPSYDILIPENFIVQIQLNEGNVVANNLYGSYFIELEFGSLHLNNFKGEFKINVSYGNIFCKVNDVYLELESSLGKIHANTFLERKVETEFKLTGNINKPINKLFVKGIKSDIFLEQIGSN